MATINSTIRSALATTGGQLANAAARVSATVGSEALNIGEGITGGAVQRVTDFLSDTGFGKAARALNLLPGAIPKPKGIVVATFEF